MHCLRYVIFCLIIIIIIGNCSAVLAVQGNDTLTGDWSGNRDWLAQKGISFDLDVANFYPGVTSGGLHRGFRYGGHGDYVMNVDFEKLGIQEGLFLKVRTEHRFGESINGDTGAFLPATLLTDLPVRDSDEIYITNFQITQAFSEHFAIFAGKLDTLDGDDNAFAHGRGKTQFSNVSFVANPIALRTVPYSTLGMGFVILGEGGEPIFTYTLLNSTDTAETDGFNELFSEGVAMAAELRLPTNFGNMPGHQLFALSWNSRSFVNLGQDPRLVLPNAPIDRKDGSWSAYWNFDQYLHVDRSDPQRGWGLFGRAGIADDETNPLGWFLSCGVGGNNPTPGHEADTFGAGWFIAGTSDEIGQLLGEFFGAVGDGQGVELFYNWQATPWLNVTPDLQVIMPGRKNVNTTLMAGLRGVVRL